MLRRAGPCSMRPATRLRPSLFTALAAACATVGMAGDPAPSGWHHDIAGARTASATSQRPILALFIASWSPESRSTGAALQSSEEVAAVVASGFEPVVVDAATDSEFTRRVGVSHIPSVVVLGAGDRVLASFECPAAIPAFIAAVKRAADEVAAATASATAAAAGSRAPADGPQAGSIAVVTAKVRNLSTFAGTPATQTVASTRPVDLHDSFGSGPTTAPAEPTLPVAPPAWHAERPVAPLAVAAPTIAATRPAIEPASAAPQSLPQPVATSTPWLTNADAAEPETTASVSDLGDLPIPNVAPPADAPRTAAAWPWSNLKNPFAKQPRKPLPPVAKAEPPATMPPARPQWPGTIAATVPQPPPAAAAPTTAPSAQPVPAQPQVAAAPATGGQPVADSMPLGLEGYCPVTLAEKQAWAEGRPQYGVRHRGRTYLFAGPEQQRTFLADPDRYAPALSGDDPVLAFDQGRSMPGQRRYGVVCQSRMYLFASPETCEAFKANPEKYAGRVALAERNMAGGTRTY